MLTGAYSALQIIRNSLRLREVEVISYVYETTNLVTQIKFSKVLKKFSDVLEKFPKAQRSWFSFAMEKAENRLLLELVGEGNGTTDPLKGRREVGGRKGSVW